MWLCPPWDALKMPDTGILLRNEGILRPTGSQKYVYEGERRPYVE
jgi:hypothetical protein